MAKIIDAAIPTAGKPCDLGDDPLKYLKKFEEWYEHTSLLADSIGVKDKTKKLRLTLLCGGKDFLKLTDKNTLDTAITKIRGHRITCDNREIQHEKTRQN